MDTPGLVTLEDFLSSNLFQFCYIVYYNVFLQEYIVSILAANTNNLH